MAASSLSTVKLHAGISRLQSVWSAIKVRTEKGADPWSPRMRPGRNYVALYWTAGGRGKPGINANIQDPTEATRMIADPDFEVLGTNADSSCTAFNAEGGVTLTTKTTSGDQVILCPHLDSNQSAWSAWTWGTDRCVEWEAYFAAPATITSMVVWAGLKLTNTSVVATDDDQVFIRYEAGVNSGKWQVISSIGGTDTTTNTGLTFTASAAYKVTISIDTARVARIYINDELMYTTAALTDATDLIPYIGVQTATTAARAITVYGAQIQRKVV